MLNFLKKLFGVGLDQPKKEVKSELLTPQHNVNPAPTTKKPKAPKAPPNPRAKKVKVEVKAEQEAPKKRGRPAKKK